MSNEIPAASPHVTAPDVESVARMAATLLEHTRREALALLSRPQQEDIEEGVRSFFDEMTRTVLGWISSGYIQNLQRLAPALDRVRREHAEEPGFLETVPLNQGITAHLDLLSHMIRVLMSMDSPETHLSRLSGQRRAAWRDLLAAMYEYGTPVRKGDALGMAPGFRDDGAVYHALQTMADMGLIERHEESGKKAVLYSLTWSGRAVARSLRERDPGAGTVTSLEEYRDCLIEWDREPPHHKWIETVRDNLSEDLIVPGNVG